MSFTSKEYRQLQPLIDKARTAAIVTHIHPDGDGVGSGLGLARFLTACQVDTRFITSHPLPRELRFLASDAGPVLYDADSWSAYVRGADLIFTVDNSSTERLGPLEADVRASQATRVCIDHHLVRNDFWQINLIDEQAAATGEMVYDLIRELDGSIDLPTAQALYVAIVTDTGRFRFSKTSGKLHRLAAEFLELGVKPHAVHHELHEHNTADFIRLTAHALLRMRFAAGGRLCWVDLPAALLSKCNSQEEDTSEVINTMLSIDGVEVGLLFRETVDGRTKISLRSKNEHDVNALALAHGGGGHKNAAGAVVNESLEACSRLLVAEAETLLG